MEFGTDQTTSSDSNSKTFPYFIEDGTGMTSDGGKLIIIATSEVGVLYITNKGVSFSIRREMITTSEAIGSHLIHRSNFGLVIGIDLMGPTPYLFRRMDLKVPGKVVDELTKGMRFAAQPYRILHGEMKASLESFGKQSEPFPQIIKESHQLS